MKLRIATVTHNFKWVKIIYICRIWIKTLNGNPGNLKLIFHTNLLVCRTNTTAKNGCRCDQHWVNDLFQVKTHYILLSKYCKRVLVLICLLRLPRCSYVSASVVQRGGHLGLLLSVLCVSASASVWACVINDLQSAASIGLWYYDEIVLIILYLAYLFY